MNEILLFECPSCGAKISTDKKTCDYCGSQIKIQDNEKKDSALQSQSIKQQEPLIPQQVTEPVKIITQPIKPAKTLSGLAVASFVLSLIGFGPISLILGIIATAMTSNKDLNLSGRGFSIAAIIISIIQIIIFIGVITSR